MLTIRLNRTGKNKRASFRVVVQEHTVAPGGRHVEVLGSYDPHRKLAVLKAERIQYWIGKGAQVSDTAFNLLVKEKVIEGKKRTKKIPKPKAEEVKAEEPKAEETKVEAPVEVVPVDEAKKEEKVAEAPKVETKPEVPVAEDKEAKKEVAPTV